MTPNQQSRLIKCLASLVGAMTIGALVLSFGEPPRPRVDEATILLASTDLIRRIDTDPHVAADRWRQIIVHYRVGTAEDSSFRLAALVRQSDYHFVITPAGGLVPGPAWHAQIPAGELPDAIRICISVAGEESGVRQPQRAILEGLVEALARRCGIGREAVRLSAASDIESL